MPLPTSSTMWAAILPMIILRSANASWSTEHVQKLVLSGQRKPSTRYLSGTIPDTLDSCSKLILLDLSYQAFRGPIPHVVGSMIALENFVAIGNILRGPIPHAVHSMTALIGFVHVRQQIMRSHSTCCWLHAETDRFHSEFQQFRGSHSTCFWFCDCN